MALVVSLGGTAYAASKIGAADIANDAVHSRHVAPHQIAASDLAPVQRTKHVAANPSAAYDPCDGGALAQLCGTASANWAKENGEENPPGFYRDPFGVVHLQGAVLWQGASSPNGKIIFRLPRESRPAHREMQAIAASHALAFSDPRPGLVAIDPDGRVRFWAGANAFPISLDGVTFRACDTPGAEKCP